MTTLLANQKQLNDLSNKFEGRTPVRVHFLDNSSKVFLMPEYGSVKDLLTMAVEKLAIHQPKVVMPYFGLFESKNGSAIDSVLPMDSLVSEVIRGWMDAKCEKTAKFLFMIRLYLPAINGLTHRDVLAHHLKADKETMTTAEYIASAVVDDVNALHLQFVQAVYHVLTGKYPTTAEEALTLGSLHFLSKFGAFRPDRHTPGFLGNRIAEFIPVKHLKTKGTTLDAWEGRLYGTLSTCMEQEVEVRCDKDNVEVLWIKKEGDKLISLERRYLDVIYAMESYGITFFRATQKNSRILPDTLILGIWAEGLYLLDKNKSRLRAFYIEDILRWGFKPNSSFFFEIPPELNDIGAANMEFETLEGKVISDLLTDYALAFLKEKEAEEERAADNYRGYEGLVDSLASTSSAASLSLPKQRRASKAPPPVPKGSAPAGDYGRASNAAHMLDPRYRAAVKIQALYRGFQLRNEWAREDAAILIQAIFRGYKARILLSEIIEQMIKDGEL